MVEDLRCARISFWRLCLGWIRLPRRALSLHLAVYQLALRRHRYLRLPQGQLFLLSGLVGIEARVAPISALELGRKRRTGCCCLVSHKSRQRRAIFERNQPRIKKRLPQLASRMEREICARGS